jgi:hypothetical protein
MVNRSESKSKKGDLKNTIYKNVSWTEVVKALLGGRLLST